VILFRMQVTLTDDNRAEVLYEVLLPHLARLSGLVPRTCPRHRRRAST
jgi:hypothetical protein